MNSYAVDDWWSGEICLNTCPILIEGDYHPIICSINDFESDDKIAIKKLQKEIWDSHSVKYYTKLKLDYNQKINNTRFKETYLESYLLKLRELLNPHSEYFSDFNNKVIFKIPGIDRIEFELQYFNDYEMFIKNYLINGNPIEYDFIHSPNFTYQFHKHDENFIIPQVYAHCNSIFMIEIEKYYNELKILSNRKNTNDYNINFYDLKSFKNKFDDTDEYLLINYFFYELVTKKYIYEYNLYEYLRNAFELQKSPSQLLKFNNGVKKKEVYTIFYKFYKEIATNPTKQKIRYAELLANYFVGYNTIDIMKNFSRAYIKPIIK